MSDAKHGIARSMADAFAAVDKTTGTARLVTVLDGKRLKVELLRLTAASRLSNATRETSILFPVKGNAGVRFGAKDSPLGASRVFVVSPGESYRLEPAGGGTFYGLLVSRSTAAVTTSDTGPAWRAGKVGARSSSLRAGLNALTARLRRAASALAGKSPPPPIPGKGGLQWIPLPGGVFMMGSGSGDEGPVHRVTVKPFELTRSAVTFGQYRACAAEGACAPVKVGCASSAFTGDDQPVVCVDWHQADAFAKWAGGRLPSEAEREYATRGAGQDQKHPWGEEEASCEWTVISENGVGGCDRRATWPVCSKPQSDTAQGLCDGGVDVFARGRQSQDPGRDRGQTNGQRSRRADADSARPDFQEVRDAPMTRPRCNCR